MEKYISMLAAQLGLRPTQIEATLKLLQEGGTVPFISRYRKEATGSLDEVQITQIRDEYERLTELDSRRETILKSIEEQGKLSPELKKQILEAQTLSKLEDLYLPYRPKRKTRASMAREKGLAPLAELLQAGDSEAIAKAIEFVSAEKGVADAEEALKGARDIVAEHISEEAETREELRNLFQKKGTVQAKVISGKEEEGQKYKDYFDWTEGIKNAPSHRLLAMRRAEKEGILSLNIAPEEEEALYQLDNRHLRGKGEVREQLEMAIKDSYKRLLKPSLETEVRVTSKKRADEEAINVFVENLRQLLLAAPFGQRAMLALDPGFRTGCKLVALNAQGKLLDHAAIYPNPPQNDTHKAGLTLMAWAEKYKTKAIAIGNGTASRETEKFVRGLGLPADIQIIVVNESGASIYSASEVAREEFPDHDVTVRGAVSIGRRLMDPLAELVKLDPKSIGVGQYQHDVDQRDLKKSLDETVMSCVNGVGVELNTASKELLSYVSGLGPMLAKNIVTYRQENGPFQSRKELLKVPRLGPKAYEQAAGFLRIKGGKHPLDESAVHPERYKLVEQMAKDLGAKLEDLLKNENLRKQVKLEKYIQGDVGLPTLQDILKELEKPGRDPRETFETFSFDDTVHEISDLRPGMKLPGIVTNITDFGCFVDVGVHQDGLVHVSELANRYVSHPTEVVKVHQKVQVMVMDVDVARKRIGLSIKAAEGAGGSPMPKKRKAQGKVQKRKSEAQEPSSMEDKLAALKNRFR